MADLAELMRVARILPPGRLAQWNVTGDVWEPAKVFIVALTETGVLVQVAPVSAGRHRVNLPPSRVRPTTPKG